MCLCRVVHAEQMRRWWSTDMKVARKGMELAGWEIMTSLVHLITQLSWETKEDMQSRVKFMETGISAGKEGKRVETSANLVTFLLVCNRETK